MLVFPETGLPGDRYIGQSAGLGVGIKVHSDSGHADSTSCSEL